MVKDPVCGMKVEETTAQFKSEYKGKTYYFCASSCKETFDKNPETFTNRKSDYKGGCCCGHC